MKLFITLSFLWFLANPCSHAVGLHLHRVTVRLTNRLGFGRVLTVHCRSKDDDLGRTILRDEAETRWSFHSNVWGTTLFYCQVEWGGARSRTHYQFDAYDDDRDHRRCRSECRWMITNLGTLSGFNEDTGYWESFALRKA